MSTLRLWRSRANGICQCTKSTRLGRERTFASVVESQYADRKVPMSRYEQDRFIDYASLDTKIKEVREKYVVLGDVLEFFVNRNELDYEDLSRTQRRCFTVTLTTLKTRTSSEVNHTLS